MSDFEELFPDLAQVPDEGKWRARFWEKYRELESRYGRNETYPHSVKQLIIRKIVPEWVFRGGILAQDENLVDRCQKAAIALERLHDELERLGLL